MDYTVYENGEDCLRQIIEKAVTPTEVKAYIRVTTYDERTCAIWDRAVEKLRNAGNSLSSRILAYVLLMRYVHLVVAVKRHPKFDSDASKMMKAEFKKRAEQALDRIGKLKPLLIKSLDDEIRLAKERKLAAEIEEEVEALEESMPVPVPVASAPPLAPPEDSDAAQSEPATDMKQDPDAPAPKALPRWRFLKDPHGNTFKPPPRENPQEPQVSQVPGFQPVYTQMIAGSISQGDLGEVGKTACVCICLNFIASLLSSSGNLPSNTEELDTLVQLGVEIHVAWHKRKGTNVVENRAFDEMLPAIEYITLEAGNIEFGQVVSSSNPNEGLKAICKKTLSKAGKRFYLLTLRGLTAAIVTEPNGEGYLYFDSHKRHPQTGMVDGDGKAVQILFATVENLIDYLMELHKGCTDYFELVNIRKGIPRYNPR